MVKSTKLPASAMAWNSKLFFQHDTLLIVPVTFMIYTVRISSTLLIVPVTFMIYTVRISSTYSHFFIKHDSIFYKISLFLKPNYTSTWNTQTPYCTQMSRAQMVNVLTLQPN